MNKNFKGTDKIGEIVTIFPGASNVFLEYRIDFCCGGNRPLSEAIKEQNLEEGIVLNNLNAKYEAFQEQNEKFTDWAKEAPGKLIDYIVSTHHVLLKEELPKISELVFKILKVHGKSHKELFEVHKLFNTVRTELEGHLVKEEEFLFPLIKEYEKSKNLDVKNDILSLIEDLEKEHTGAGDVLKELREVTDHFTAPADGCTTFKLTYKKLNEMELDLFQHIHLENNILFKNI